MGQFPNNALFHAEATGLLRASRENGGSLAGLTFDMFVSRRMCPSCLVVLPLLGLELGNPAVTFVDPAGRRRTMRDGHWLECGASTKKSVYFDTFDGPFWPEPAALEPYFLAPKGQEWFFESGNDGAGLWSDGLYGTDHLTPKTGRVDVVLHVTGHPDLGVSLYYRKWNGQLRRTFGYSSKGALSRLRDFVRDLHGDPHSAGLYIPFAEAWPAVKEFIEREGELPRSIAWIPDEHLPPGTFPDP